MVIRGLTLEGFNWAFTNIFTGSWYPLTWLSHMLDCQLFGLNPRGHHFTGLLLHSINTVMIFYLLKQMTGLSLPSLLVALIFAFHPLHVEPVAWASSRKDLLSTIFWILTIWSYVYYSKKRGFKRYLLVLLLFSMGLMSKPMLVTLPFVLILLDYWPICRIDIGQSSDKYSLQAIHTNQTCRPITHFFKLIAEKIPLIILSLAFIFLTYIAQKDYGAVVPLNSYSISSRLSNALVSYVSYICKSILPIGLSVHYPLNVSLPLWKVITSFSLLILISLISIRFYRRYPYLIIGWLWFIVTLVPVIGLIQIGNQSMAARYSYIPLIGLAIIFAFGLHHLLQNFRIYIFSALICILIIPLIMLTTIQLGYWQNGITLFGHAVELDKNNLRAHNNLGFALAIAGRTQESIPHFYRALENKKMEYEAHFNLGNAFQTLKQYDKAILHYRAALAINPEYLKASLNLGSVYYYLHEYDKALNCFSNVLRINAGHAGAHNNIGVIMIQKGRINEAIFHFKEAIKNDPNNIMTIKNLKKIQNSVIE
jgi:tetratricopeptide (TPR) repeat protein